jgi:hypothetical protein
MPQGVQIDVLDATLPEELRNVVVFNKAIADQTASTDTGQTTPSQENTMPDMTPEQIRAMASEEAGKLINAKDSQAQVAAKIADLSEQAHKATASATAAADQAKGLETKLQTANGTIETLKSDLQKANASIEQGKADLKKKGDEYTTLEGNHTKAVAELNTVKSNAVKASRTEALNGLGLNDEAFVKKATAANADGTLTMNDEQFTGWINELKVVQDKAKATASAAPPAPVTPAPAVTTTTVTPAQGTAAAATPATPPAPVATPAAPDLSGADAMVRATAAMLQQGAQTTVDGRAQMASAFGCA